MLSKEPSVRPTPCAPPIKSPKKAMGMMTATEPSSTRLRAESSEASSMDVPATTAPLTPTPHPEEPLLYLIPSQVFPTYRPLPALVQVMVLLLSMWTSAVSTWKHLTFLQPLAVLRGWRAAPSPAECIAFVVKTILFTLVTQFTLQDLLLPPSRISMAELRQRFHLPSAISNYKSFQVPSRNGTPVPIGVHYVKYTNAEIKEPYVFDAIHCHHGFGASSLSWLPTLPSLVNRLGARVGLGHDMVGFGFTDRQKELEWYSTDASARISKEVLLHESSSVDKPLKRVALFGHSLGSLGVLKMALQLPKETAKFIVLCSPALGFSGNFPDESILDPPSGVLGKFKAKIGSIFRRGLVFPVSGYVLRRIVGLKNSWRFGLKATAWANPNDIKDSDVLRYQWPAVGKGWERGILQFVRAQTKVDDKELLRKVLALPNTTVAVIVGSEDKVVPPSFTRRFLSDFQDQGRINLVELKGLGHVSFEEDVEGFIDALEGILKSD